MSTRNIQNVLKNLGLENISPSYVSSLSAGLDEKVHAFMERPIRHDIRYMYVDATYFRVRDLSACRSKALYIVIGITADGYREFMGCRLYDSENQIDYEGLFESLKERGLGIPDLVISGGHIGIVKQALENPDLLPIAEEYLMRNNMEKAADMFDRWHSSL